MPRQTPFTFAFNSPAEALAALLTHITPVESAPVPLDRAAGRILAQDAKSDRPSPPFDVSAMDGFALRFADISTSDIPIVGEVRVGREPPPLPHQACLRIVTGGAIPTGADTIIKREDAAEHNGRITINPSARPSLKRGDHIRRAGENLPAGAPVVAKGTLITPAIAAALAAFGISTPCVYEPARVTILTTGDELVAFDETPTPWQLRDSNALALITLLAPLRCIAIEHHHIPDDADQLAQAVARALTTSDALLLTGGVSMGHRDFVTDALAANRVRTLFHGLPQRPGKPILGGITTSGKPVLALPGNPVSVMVTARRIALPALLARAGFRGMGLPAHVSFAAPFGVVYITNPVTKTTDLWWHRPVRLISPGQAELIDAKSSGDIVGAARAEGFIELPPNQQGPGPWPFYPWHF